MTMLRFSAFDGRNANTGVKGRPASRIVIELSPYMSRMNAIGVKVMNMATCRQRRHRGDHVVHLASDKKYLMITSKNDRDILIATDN